MDTQVPPFTCLHVTPARHGRHLRCCRWRDARAGRGPSARAAPSSRNLGEREGVIPPWNARIPPTMSRFLTVASLHSIIFNYSRLNK
jgi:hypothetical protein